MKKIIVFGGILLIFLFVGFGTINYSRAHNIGPAGKVIAAIAITIAVIGAMYASIRGAVEMGKGGLQTKQEKEEEPSKD